jgi:plasmid maintenance system killer protein
MNWDIIDYKHKKVINNLPIQCKKKYAAFKYIAQQSGLDGLRLSPGFKLETLKGKLAGLYSIRLNISYRVVFDVQEQIRIIDILEVSKHEYNP